jgi:hypothetical protein
MLIIMASKIEKVLEIEAADSYKKRPTDPRITIEVRNISKFHQLHSHPLHGKGSLHEGHHHSKNFIFQPLELMLKMPHIWAFCSSMHNNQNHNLGRERCYKQPFILAKG